MSRASTVNAVAPERGAARERIMAEALDLFQARGFADTSMQQIAERVGVTKAALYYHFPSKEQLFAAIIKEGVNHLWRGVIDRAAAEGPLRDVLRDVVAFIIATMNHINVTSLAEDVRRHLPVDEQLAIFTEHPTPDESFRRLFERAIAAGEMRPLPRLDILASTFNGMVMGMMHAEHEHRVGQPEDVDLLLDVFLNGVGVRTTPSSG